MSTTFSPLTSMVDGDGISGSSSKSDAGGSNEYAIGTSSVYKAAFNFINSIIGAGIIGMPFAFGECGIVGGSVLITFVAVLVATSVRMLIECGMRAGILDYEDLARHLLGDKGYYAALISMFLFGYGAQIAYLVVIGDTIPLLTGANRNLVIGLIAVFVILPLSSLKDLGNLSYTSLASIVFDITIIIIVLVNAPSAAKSQDINPSLENDNLDLFSPRLFAGIGTISFAFVCMHNSFIVFRSLETRTEENWKNVAYSSVGFCYVIAFTFGLVGYLSFGDEVEGDVLNNFHKPRASIDVARALLAICMIFVYPMEMFVTRHCIRSLIQEYRRKRSADKEIDGNVDGAKNRLVGHQTGSQDSTSSLQVDGNGMNTIDDRPGEGEDDMEVIHFSDEVSRGQSQERNGAATANAHEQYKGTTFHWHGSLPWYENVGSWVESMMNDVLVYMSSDDNKEHVGVTFLLWFVSVIIAMSTDDLGVVLALTGAAAASCLGYILPALIYLKSYNEEFSTAYTAATDESHPAYVDDVLYRLGLFKQFYMAFFMVFFGGMAFVFGIATVFSPTPR